MDAFVLAGDRGASHQILGMNKALLHLEGYPLFIHVLKALDGVPEIARIFIIGPQKKMMEEIERALPYTLFVKKIEVLEQKKQSDRKYPRRLQPFLTGLSGRNGHSSADPR
ncbi:MAG: NTP transferase domain-containing protein [Candidatus Manganitrophus sp.]|nr:NTP transferase domain-containing protein [Candidatus Manganitrophus sp.]